jgi:hypothetical protein
VTRQIGQKKNNSHVILSRHMLFDVVLLECLLIAANRQDSANVRKHVSSPCGIKSYHSSAQKSDMCPVKKGCRHIPLTKRMDRGRRHSSSDMDELRLRVGEKERDGD